MLHHALRAESTKPSFTYNGSANDSTDLTTYSFTSVSIGTAATNRLVFVTVTSVASGNRLISSATIGGISATVIESTPNAGASTKIIYAVVPTGTTATISITFDSTVLRCGVGSYSIYNLKSTSPVSRANGSTWTSGAISATLSVPENAIILAGVSNSTNSNTFTWTNLTSNYDSLVDATFRFSGASAQVSTGNSSYTVTATSTSAAAGRLYVYAWR